MLVLWQDGPCAIGDLAQRLELEPHALSPIVARLQTAGLVERQPGRDRRSRTVVLTERGRVLEADAVRVHAEVACATGLDPEELALRSRLRALAAELGVSRSAVITHPGHPVRRHSPIEGEAS